MQKYTFHRPKKVPFPSVWHTFKVVKEGEVVNLTVQDLTDDLVEDAMDLMNTYYNRDEVASKSVDVLNHPTALEELDKFWRHIIQQKLSLVCVANASGGTGTAGHQVVGVNCIDVLHKNDDFEPWKSEDRASQMLSGSYELVSRSCDVFQKYNVDKYLNANGMTVHPEWRKMGVAVEILKARVPFCRALGIKLTATVFTGTPSQAVAKKAGFKTISEITYEEMREYGYNFPGLDREASMLMAFEIF